MRKRSWALVLPCCLICQAPPTVLAAAAISVHKSERNGLLAWRASGGGFSVEFIQVVPDYVRAVFGKHRFPKEELERIAGYCVFGSILQNTSRQQLSYRVADWYYTDRSGRRHPVKTKTQWLQEWRRADIKFSWLMLADGHDFEVGDWQQGFTTIKQPRDEQFDLTYTWKLGGVSHSATIEDMSCAPATPEG